MSQCSQSNRSQFLRMFDRTCTKKLLKNKSDRGNNACKNLDYRANKICILFLPTCYKKESRNQSTIPALPSINSSQSRCLGIAKSTFLKEFKKRSRKEDREF